MDLCKKTGLKRAFSTLSPLLINGRKRLQFTLQVELEIGNLDIMLKKKAVGLIQI
nr:MAG TPA: hypothetical protein [Caudoviricetes sp.]